MEAKKKWKKALVGVGIGIAGFPALWMSLVSIENYRGRKAWENYQIEATARGEVLAIAPPPAIPDEENFASTPFFQTLFKSKEAADAAVEKIDLKRLVKDREWPSLGQRQLGRPISLARWQRALGTENLRDTLDPSSSLIDEVSAVSQRSKTRFPLNYDAAFAMDNPHFSGLIKLSSLLNLRANLLLAEGNSEAALADLKLILRLGDAAFSYPQVVSLLVRNSINENALNLIWGGLVSKQWKRSDLEQIKASLQEAVDNTAIIQALEGERTALNRQWHRFTTASLMKSAASSLQTRIGLMLLPQEGWLYQNQVAGNRSYQQVIEGFSKIPIDQGSLVVKSSALKIYSALADITLFPLNDIIMRSLSATNSVQQALIACALEEYRIDHGSFPKSLANLVTKYLDGLPIDPLTAQPQIYRLTDDGNYLLYSIGWNLKDDGGTVVMKGEKRRDEKQGDWVWYGSPQTNLTKE